MKCHGTVEKRNSFISGCFADTLLNVIQTFSRDSITKYFKLANDVEFRFARERPHNINLASR